MSRSRKSTYQSRSSIRHGLYPGCGRDPTRGLLIFFWLVVLVAAVFGGKYLIESF